MKPATAHATPARADMRRLPTCPQCGSDDVVIGDVTCSCNGCGERFATGQLISDQRSSNQNSKG